MVKFINDTIVVPRESQWFEFYAPGQDTDIVSLRNSRLYTNVRLTLQTCVIFKVDDYHQFFLYFRTLWD